MAKEGKSLSLSPQAKLSPIPVGSLFLRSVPSPFVLLSTHFLSKVQGALVLPESTGILCPFPLYTKKDQETLVPSPLLKTFF